MLQTLKSGWRSALGTVSMVLGATAAATSTDTHFAPWLTLAGAAVVAAERIGQALEKPSATTETAAEKAANQLVKDFEAFQASQGKA